MIDNGGEINEYNQDGGRRVVGGGRGGGRMVGGRGGRGRVGGRMVKMSV